MICISNKVQEMLMQLVTAPHFENQYFEDGYGLGLLRTGGVTELSSFSGLSSPDNEWVHILCGEYVRFDFVLGASPNRDSFCGYLFVCYLLTLSWASEGPCIWILISLWSLIQNQATMGRFLCSFPLPVHRIFSSPHWIYIFKVSSFRCQVFRVQFYSVLLLSLYFFWFHL